MQSEECVVMQNGHENSSTMRVEQVKKAGANAEYNGRREDGTSERTLAVIKNKRRRELSFICVNRVIELEMRNGPQSRAYLSCARRLLYALEP